MSTPSNLSSSVLPHVDMETHVPNNGPILLTFISSTLPNAFNQPSTK